MKRWAIVNCPSGTASDPRRQRSGAFTLVEVLLALAICAIVLVAINAVFATAVRLREKTSAAVDQSIPVSQALETVRRDLKSVAGPHGFMAGDFKCNAQTMGANMGQAAGSASGLDFFSTTGVISDNAPWGDLQEVFYQLMPPADRNRALGQDFVRCVNRNLLAMATQIPETQVLLTDVESVDFECFDGLQWRNNWDTSLSDTNLPTAVRIRIQPAVDRTSAKPPPYDITVPLVTQTRGTNTTSSSSSATSTSSP